MKIKICGLFREQDIGYVNEAMPDYAGFILHFPKSHRNLEIPEAKRLISHLAPGIRVVLVFVDQPPGKVIRTAAEVQPDILQLHGREDNSYIEDLRSKTGLEIWKAFRIRTDADLSAAAACSADAVLLDNGYGTGQAFDWSKAVGFHRPFILAGGLTPENIPEAAAKLHPMAVDISSGVEENLLKDRRKILAAVEAAHAEIPGSG